MVGQGVVTRDDVWVFRLRLNETVGSGSGTGGPGNVPSEGNYYVYITYALKNSVSSASVFAAMARAIVSSSAILTC